MTLVPIIKTCPYKDFHGILFSNETQLSNGVRILQHMKTRMLKKSIRDESDDSEFEDYQVLAETMEYISDIHTCQTECVNDLMRPKSSALKCVGYHFIWDKTAEDSICTFYYGANEFTRRLGIGITGSDTFNAPTIGTIYTRSHVKDEIRDENFVENLDGAREIGTINNTTESVIFTCARGGKLH